MSAVPDGPTVKVGVVVGEFCARGGQSSRRVVMHGKTLGARAANGPRKMLARVTLWTASKAHLLDDPSHHSPVHILPSRPLVHHDARCDGYRQRVVHPVNGNSDDLVSPLKQFVWDAEALVSEDEYDAVWKS